MFSGSGALQEMLVHLVGAGQELGEVLRPHRDHHRQAHRAPDRVAPADPVPEAEDAGGVDAPGGGLVEGGGDGGEVAAGELAERVLQPGLGGAGVGHRLDGGEGLRGDDDQRPLRVEGLQHVVDMRPVHVRYEMRARPVMIGRERQGRHHRAEVRAADADVDDVGEPAPVGGGDGAGAHAVGEGRHAVEHAVDLGHHVLAVHEDRLAGAVAQRDVQDRPVLGGVDPGAGEHKVAPLRHPARRRELDEQRQRARVDGGLGEVEQHVAEPHREAVEAVGIPVEER